MVLLRLLGLVSPPLLVLLLHPRQVRCGLLMHAFILRPKSPTQDDQLKDTALHVTRFCPAELADTGPVTAGGPFCTVRLLQIRKVIRPAGPGLAGAAGEGHCRSLAHHPGTTRRQR